MIRLTEKQLEEYGNNYRARVAEQAVLLDIMLNGFDAAFTPIENAPYDLVMDTDKGLLRVQVKSTSYTQKKKKKGKIDQKVYAFSMKNAEKEATDIYAFVALHTGEVVYAVAEDIPAVGSTASEKRFGVQSFTAQSEGSFERMAGKLNIATVRRAH